MNLKKSLTWIANRSKRKQLKKRHTGQKSYNVSDEYLPEEIIAGLYPGLNHLGFRNRSQ